MINFKQAVEEQFNYLNKITYADLEKEELPFLDLIYSDDNNFKYEVTLSLNSPNLFLLIDENGHFEVQGHSSWYPTLKMNGRNTELLEYFNMIEESRKL